MSDFKKALLWTAIPIGGLSIISVAGSAILRNGTIFGSVFTFFWVAAVACFMAAFAAMIFFIFKRRNRVVAGIIAGMGIGIVALGSTCFANTAVGGL